MAQEIKTEDFEKLGVFYLGRPYDLETRQRQPGLYLYDSRDLVTHAICLGMTGSGKTGLCIDLLEEAAIDGIPVIAVDPKGDLSNLLLTFPGLGAQEFKPWVDEAEAARNNLSLEDYAGKEAQRWRDGLSEWGQDADRIKRLRDSADVSIFTPGSSAGSPVSILSSLAAPGREVVADIDIFSDRVATTATCLLSLIGVDAELITSREHILLSTILNRTWSDYHDLNLERIIELIQNPPVDKVGAFDLETFYPAKDRLTLAMKLNNLLAAPGFRVWLEGQPLDVDQLFYSGQGKPRVSIFSISHLSEAERMFFVSLLLNQLLAWMRVQVGTSSLRSIFYMDEIFGYFPPVANPPSKKPLLTLLKQARAFGLGVVLATQNPADLDYKGLSNIGTWFLGRLQTARDKERVLEGLEVSANEGKMSFDRGQLDKIISSLGSRIFLVNNVHDSEPHIIETRWAMSYLRGPLSREEIKRLNKAGSDHTSEPEMSNLNRTGSEHPAAGAEPSTIAGLESDFLALRRQNPGDASLLYMPMLLLSATLGYSDKQFKIDTSCKVSSLIPITGNSPFFAWEDAFSFAGCNLDLQTGPAEDGQFVNLSAGLKSPDWKARLEKQAVIWLYQNHKLECFKSGSLKAISSPGESKRDFAIRLQHLARQRRDEWLDRLRKKYQTRMNSLQKRIGKAQSVAAEQSEQARLAQMNSYATVGETMLGVLMGRKSLSRANMRRAGRAYRSGRRAAKETEDVIRANAELQKLTGELQSLEMEFRRDVLDLEARARALLEEPVTENLVSAGKADIQVDTLQLVWAPLWKLNDGTTITAWV